jgi:hypothetical protein
LCAESYETCAPYRTVIIQANQPQSLVALIVFSIVSDHIRFILASNSSFNFLHSDNRRHRRRRRRRRRCWRRLHQDAIVSHSETT